jgi:thioredoxin 1
MKFLGGNVGRVEDESDWLTWMNASAGATVIVKFSASWCGPCRAIAPRYAELAKSNPSTFFLEVDVDEREDIASFAGVCSMPTFQVYRRAKKVDELVGASKEKLYALVKNNS